MYGAPREPATRQCSVDRRNAERQNPVSRSRRPFDPLDALAKFGKKWSFHAHVRFLFCFDFLSMPLRIPVDDRLPRKAATL